MTKVRPRNRSHRDGGFWHWYSIRDRIRYLGYFFFFQAEDGIRDRNVTGVQTCALPICTRIAFDANEPDRPGDRHVGVAMINGDPSHASVTMITSGRGTDTSPVWSPDGTKKIGRASCRERVEIWEGGGSVKKKREGSTRV